MPQKEYLDSDIEDLEDLYSAAVDVLEGLDIPVEESIGTALISDEDNHKSVPDFSLDQIKDLEQLPESISYTVPEAGLQIVYDNLDMDGEFYLRQI